MDFIDLPPELQDLIISYLQVGDIQNLLLTCNLIQSQLQLHQKIIASIKNKSIYENPSLKNLIKRQFPNYIDRRPIKFIFIIYFDS